MTRSVPRGVGREGGRHGAGAAETGRSREEFVGIPIREMLLMPRGQRDKHARETSSGRFVPVFVSSRPVAPRETRTTKDSLIRGRKTHAAI